VNNHEVEFSIPKKITHLSSRSSRRFHVTDRQREDRFYTVLWVVHLWGVLLEDDKAVAREHWPGPRLPTMITETERGATTGWDATTAVVIVEEAKRRAERSCMAPSPVDLLVDWWVEVVVPHWQERQLVPQFPLVATHKVPVDKLFEVAGMP
jgi:hypothetical protein